MKTTNNTANLIELITGILLRMAIYWIIPIAPFILCLIYLIIGFIISVSIIGIYYCLDTLDKATFPLKPKRVIEISIKDAVKSLISYMLYSVLIAN